MVVENSPKREAPWPPPAARIHRKHVVRKGESLESIALAEGMPVWQLIAFNFRTTGPAEVNWYLVS